MIDTERDAVDDNETYPGMTQQQLELQSVGYYAWLLDHYHEYRHTLNKYNVRRQK